MKKKITLLLCFVIILITSITALCNKNAQVLFFEDDTDATDQVDEFSFDFTLKPRLPEELSSEPVFELEEIIPEDFSAVQVEETFVDVCKTIEEFDIETFEEAKLKNRFISASLNYSMTQPELNHIKNLFEEGYDMEKLLDVYEFIRWTDCDYTSIAEIYETGIENSENENWIYDAYDKHFSRTDDMLSVEDVAYYVGNGVSVEEIVGAYELSFAGKKTTKQMLSERIAGKTWNEISATALSKNPDTVLSSPEMTIDEVMMFRSVCVRQRKDFVDISAIQGGKVSLNEASLNAERSRVLEKNRLITEYSIEKPVQKQALERKIDYSSPEPHVFAETDLFPEDLIPVEEVEVE